jgi:TonB family protein
MQLPTLDNEDRFALMVTGGVHLLLVIIFLLYSFSIQNEVRPSYIEVEFGEFRSGSPTEFAEEQTEQVATTQNPSETEPEEPEPEQPDPVEEKQATSEEQTKPVDAPEEIEEVEAEVVETPETDEIDPEQETADDEKHEVTVPPKTEEAEEQQEGEEASGDEKGNTGEIDTDQGTGNQEDKSAPYELTWEGDINRSPMMQPLPENISGAEAMLTIRFEVKPDGRVGKIIPLKKMNPELEREVMNTLHNWRFSRLPSGVPQESQWGTITFRFVLD